ncbi:MAG: hypothetical protein JNL98_17215 [Bryobacterales bacterium]|nr:hypothetical protein [Bryobacterales bacterium]
MENHSTSAAKLAANAANAQKSTGPTSAEGKEKVSQNARKHGLSGAKFFCPQHLRPLLAEIEQEYRQSIRPVGFLEEDTLIQLRNSRFNMERAQILMEELGSEADSRGVDPLADPATRKDYLLYQRYFNQNRAGMQASLRELRKLQSERTLREQHHAHEHHPGLADFGPTMRLYHQHMRNKQKQQQAQAQQAFHAMLHQPLPGEPGYRADLDPANQTNPRHASAA